MPKIPLYNEGLGQTVTTKPIQVVRANEGAFTASQKGFSALGGAIEDAAFEFGMREKKAETERVSNEEETRLRSEADDFILNNQDTDTTQYANNFKIFQQKKMREVEKNTANLTRSQRQAVKTNLSNLFSSKFADGKQQAFTKGQNIRSKSLNANLSSMITDIGTMDINDPLREIRLEEAMTKINEGQSAGLKSGYTEASFNSAVLGRDYFNEIQSASTPSKAKEIRDRASQDKRLLPGQYEKIVGATNARETQAEAEVLEGTLGEIVANSETATKKELDVAQSALTKGEPFTIGNTTYNLSAVGVGRNSELKIANAISQLASKKFDAVQTNTVETMTISATKDNPQDFLANVSSLYSENSLSLNGINKDDVDGMVVESAQQISQNVITQISAENVSDVPAAVRQLNAAEAMLKTDSSNRGALVGRVGKVGDNSAKVLSSIAKARKNLKKLVTSNVSSSMALGAFRDGNWPQVVQDDFTDPQKRGIIATGLTAKDGTSLPISQQFALLERNNAEHKLYTQSLGQGASIGLAGGFSKKENAGAPEGIKGSTVISSDNFKIVESNVLLYQAMKRYPKVLSMHTGKDETAFYDAVIGRLGYETLEMAVNNVAEANRKDIDVKPKYKMIEEKVDGILGDASKASWFTKTFTDTPVKVLNSSYVTTELKNRATQRIRLGEDPSTALDLAVEDIARTHTFIRGTLVKTDASMPPELAELSNLAITDVMKNHPYLSTVDNIDEEELTIINYGGPNTWAVAVNGSTPVQNSEGNPIIYTTSDLENLMGKDKSKKNAEFVRRFNAKKELEINGLLTGDGVYSEVATPEDVNSMYYFGQGNYSEPKTEEDPNRELPFEVFSTRMTKTQNIQSEE
tara:strand:- start:973 stop:3564 length:2592 start_codon:yes stop_codon:yes gene_type:complete